MTNEMKLLMALCDALDFKVEEVATEKSIKEREEYIRLGCAFNPKLEYEYKLTKKASDQDNDEAAIAAYEAHLDRLKGRLSTSGFKYGRPVTIKDKTDEAREIERYQCLFGRKL